MCRYNDPAKGYVGPVTPCTETYGTLPRAENGVYEWNNYDRTYRSAPHAIFYLVTNNQRNTILPWRPCLLNATLPGMGYCMHEILALLPCTGLCVTPDEICCLLHAGHARGVCEWST